ncbi:MAG: DUF3341 domain-containing protein [Deltaproteobacteria bacterium]|nr:DUF3341 domain-containing protein [Deltaproteobacteria bacterium]
MSARMFVAYFGSEDGILGATRAVREAGFEIHDVYTPYAVHGMDEAMGQRPSRITWVCFFAGAFGLAVALALQIWTSAVDWPLNVGGKPHNSFPAFIPVAFELTVLFGGLTTVAALFLRSRLKPRMSNAHVLPRVTDDRFALALVVEGHAFDADRAEAICAAHGVVETDFVEVSK